MHKELEKNKLILFLVAALALIPLTIFYANAATSSTWVKINTTGVEINATYNESVTLVTGYPKLFDEDNKSWSMDTSSLNSGKTFISTPRSQLPPGMYTYFISVYDSVSNIRNDSKSFEMLPPEPPLGCGNGVKQGTEECDDSNNVDGDGCSRYCKIERCGDSKIDAGEECDKNNLNGMDCTDDSIGRFTGGTLACYANCTFNFKNCIAKYVNGTCGDSILNDKEACDKNDWGNITRCSDFAAFISGTLKCKSDCHFDTGGCVPKTSTNFTNASCSDKQKDGDETDVDCGGSCLPCVDGKKCINTTDCTSLYCKSNLCTQPSCTDKIKNGLESDVDCGGTCPGCEVNKSCGVNNDCASAFCHPDTKKCTAPSCSDTFQNGDETDVDCGGGCPVKCALNKKCISPNDCQSGNCEAGICTADMNKDTDNDGMPDWWEDKYGLDKNDPSDADKDLDHDGFTNLEEYKMGTDPADPNDPTPKETHTLQIILLVIGLLLMVGSTGFLIYSRKVLIPQQRARAQAAARAAMPQARPGQPVQGARLVMGGKPGAVVPRQALKARLAERIAKRQGARKSLLEGFGKSKAETRVEAGAGVGAGARETAKPVSEAKKSKPSEEFVSLSALGKKKLAAQTKESGEETKPASKKQSDAFEKLKELSEARKKKQTNK